MRASRLVTVLTLLVQLLLAQSAKAGEPVSFGLNQELVLSQDGIPGTSPPNPLLVPNPRSRTKVVSIVGIALGLAAIGYGLWALYLDGQETDCRLTPTGNSVCLRLYDTAAVGWASLAAGGTLSLAGGFGTLRLRW